jgi:hypothetical protein
MYDDVTPSQYMLDDEEQEGLFQARAMNEVDPENQRTPAHSNFIHASTERPGGIRHKPGISSGELLLGVLDRAARGDKAQARQLVRGDLARRQAGRMLAQEHAARRRLRGDAG